jgi:hypothetical protein
MPKKCNILENWWQIFKKQCKNVKIRHRVKNFFYIHMVMIDIKLYETRVKKMSHLSLLLKHLAAFSCLNGCFSFFASNITKITPFCLFWLSFYIFENRMTCSIRIVYITVKIQIMVDGDEVMKERTFKAIYRQS